MTESDVSKDYTVFQCLLWHGFCDWMPFLTSTTSQCVLGGFVCVIITIGVAIQLVRLQILLGDEDLRWIKYKRKRSGQGILLALETLQDYEIFSISEKRNISLWEYIIIFLKFSIFVSHLTHTASLYIFFLWWYELLPSV